MTSRIMATIPKSLPVVLLVVVLLLLLLLLLLVVLLLLLPYLDPATKSNPSPPRMA
jgi:hypothetical protein